MSKHVEYAADPLDAARGIVFAAGLGLIAWSGLVLLFVTVWRWL